MPGAARSSRAFWWTSARLQITAGITVALAISQILVLIAAQQFLWASTDRAADQRVEREVADFVDYITSPIALQGTGPENSASEILRSYLARQYPEADMLIVGTNLNTGAQFTLSRNSPDEDRVFTPDVRSAIQELGLGEAPPASTDVDIRWDRVDSSTIFGPVSLIVALDDSRERAETTNIMRILSLLSVAGIALTALLAWWLAGRMLEPVRRIRMAADQISAADLSHRVPEGGPDELAALSETVNAMLDRVETAYHTQREFLDDVGHELRTPLTVVQANLDLLPEDPVERADTTRIMQDELSRMTRIVEDLLTLARADRPDFLQVGPVEVSELVLDVEAKIEVVADREWVVFPDAEGEALLDRHRITQALVQFCANAVRFTDTGDRIEIGCTIREEGQPTIGEQFSVDTPLTEPDSESDQRRLLWWVRDTGPGVPDGQQELIFQRFHTASGQLRDGRGGTGLGLAIVSSIAAGHGGRAFVFNLSAGGAVFCFVVPFIRP